MNQDCALPSPAPAVRFGSLVPVEQHGPSPARRLPSLGSPAVLRDPGWGEPRGPSSPCRSRRRAPSAGPGAELPLPVPGGSGRGEQEQKGSRSTSFPGDSPARRAQTGRTGRAKGARAEGGTGATRCPALGDKPREQRVKQRCSCRGLPCPGRGDRSLSHQQRWETRSVATAGLCW